MQNLTREGDAPEGILIIDFGSQYTLLIAKRLREIGVYSEILSPAACAEKSPSSFIYRGIILSGGPGFVSPSAASAPQCPLWVRRSGLPILGICYGMQLLIDQDGGEVRAGEKSEAGPARVELLPQPRQGHGALFAQSLPTQFTVWMSHFDDIKTLPSCYQSLALTAQGVIAAICHKEEKIWAVQFHPEVSHTDFGDTLLGNFAFSLCGLHASWTMPHYLPSLIAQLRLQVPAPQRVLVAVSGGVDSTVLAAVLKQALGNERVEAVLVDTGLQRKDEVAWVAAQFKSVGFSLSVLSCQDDFFSALADISEPETKRKIIGRLFIEIFTAYADAHGPFAFLAQGTLYPDVIESAAGGAGAQVIKSHHNVGGLPEKMGLALLEPFRFLFKDEVRRVGMLVNLPASLVYRHPFPGPGLAIRIPGPVDREGVALLQEADAIYTAALKDAGYYEQIWQAAAILLPVKSVGVMGDNRTYQRTCVLRAVLSQDGMTAEVSDLPLAFLTATAGKIISQVPGINRVLYDVTSKPPATIEWE